MRANNKIFLQKYKMHGRLAKAPLPKSGRDIATNELEIIDFSFSFFFNNGEDEAIYIREIVNFIILWF